MKNKIPIRWLPALLADYYDWLEGIKEQTYEIRKEDEKYPPRIKTALIFLRSLGFWKEQERKEQAKKEAEK